MKSFIKKYDYLLILCICALFIVGIIYKLQSVAPLGENSLLTIDFFHQYGPMLAELRDRILSGNTLMYSFRMGMGLPFFRNFFNYLSSPFNILLLLFKHKDILMSYSIIIGLKSVAASLTMCFYLKNKLGKNYSFIALSLLYAFCAYFTAYYWNIMWIDGMVMLPLIAAGIDKLVNKSNILLYVISLFVMIFANYFIGYMLCIFSVIYFLLELFIETKTFDWKKIGNKILKFSGASLIAGGLCAVFLIPLFLGLREISATGDVFPSSQYYAFTLKEFIFNHFTGVGSTVLKSGITCAPNISVGVLSIGLLILFIINGKISNKIKMGYIGMLIFLAICFRVAPLDYIWHAFHVPNDLPYRYSFIYSFILIVICAYSIKNIKYIKQSYVTWSYIIMLVFITLLKLLGFNNINNDMFIVNYILITLYYLCYILFTGFKKQKKTAIMVLIITASLECVMVVNNNWNIDQNIEGFYADYSDVKNSLNYIKKDNADFYRLEKLSMLTFNDPSWYGYNGQVTFSSMEYENMATLQYSLGMPGNEINSYYYKQNTPIYDLMFNIKYLLGDSEDIDRYSKYYQTDYYDTYNFKYNVGLLFGVNNELKNWKSNYDDPFKNQNDFIEKATGISGVFEKISDVRKETVFNNDYGEKIVKYSFKNFNDNYYLYLNEYCDFVYIDGDLYYLNDDYGYFKDYGELNIYSYIDYNEKFIINKKSNMQNVDIYIGYSYTSTNDDLDVYKLNIDKFNKAYKFLLDKRPSIQYIRDDYFRIDTNYSEDTLIYSSIPYDEGWQVFVDSERVSTDNIANSLLGFSVPSGKHLVELKYRIPYFKVGMIINILSLCTLVIWLYLDKKKIKSISYELHPLE